MAACDYKPFAYAIRRLRRIMGDKAPDVIALIQTNLRGRDARGLTDDYLDSAGWPFAERRATPRKCRGMRRRPEGAPRGQRELENSLRLPADPSRN
jgi:hypothetical protein